MDADGIPLPFALFLGNTNKQKSLKPLEEMILSDFDYQKFIYCRNVDLGSEDIRSYKTI